MNSWSSWWNSANAWERWFFTLYGAWFLLGWLFLALLGVPDPMGVWGWGLIAPMLLLVVLEVAVWVLRRFER